MNRRDFFKVTTSVLIGSQLAPAIKLLSPPITGGYLVPDEFYEAIIAGVKRVSPLILDNVGLKVAWTEPNIACRNAIGSAPNGPKRTLRGDNA